MAKTKQVKPEDPKADVSKKVILSSYKPLPRFSSGCKTC